MTDVVIELCPDENTAKAQEIVLGKQGLKVCSQLIKGKETRLHQETQDTVSIENLSPNDVWVVSGPV